MSLAVFLSGKADKDAMTIVFQIILAPVIPIVATIIGFYFGSEQSSGN